VERKRRFVQADAHRRSLGPGAAGYFCAGQLSWIDDLTVGSNIGPKKTRLANSNREYQQTKFAITL
jgi:hypothetical protein